MGLAVIGVALAAVPLGPQDGGYREAFERGVAALAAGRRPEAVEHFRAARPYPRCS